MSPPQYSCIEDIEDIEGIEDVLVSDSYVFYA